MKIQFKKRRGKPSILNCIREDGSTTWSEIHPNFEIHDFAHFAVETVLGFTQAFYGLLASGFNIEDFELPRDQRPEELIPDNLPVESLQTEHIVNLLTTAMQNGAGDFDLISTLKEILAENGLPYPPDLTSETLGRIQENLNDLLEQWDKLEEGSTMELNFSR
ncbi:hypothetical protein [Flagellimonas myxillae]|uniref:hypothetical protein n=1 Tax=Flagellimonas myxillae TaxID=2942214 RepID=UPI00201F857C|nr:hypothetical protein [Muricauda myxillae]MCL6267408.1 hypothetical protein [Muricauda myxillae]